MKNLKVKLIICCLLFAVLFLASCAKMVPVEKRCSVDSDCVKAVCCHSKAALNKQFGPDCAGQFCTAECVPGTLDCNQGEVKCVSGGCKVVMK